MTTQRMKERLAALQAQREQRGPKSLAARVSDSRERLRARGGQPVPRGWFSPAAAADLAYLDDGTYAASRTAILERALREAVKREKRRRRRK